MFDDDKNLDFDVDNIINQIKTKNNSIKKIETERPELRKEDVEKFVIDNASAVVQDSTEMITALKDIVISSADAKTIEAVSELVKAVSGALSELSKFSLNDSKLKSQKELKQMDIEARKELVEETQIGGFITASREEVLRQILNHHKPKLDNTIDV